MNLARTLSATLVIALVPVARSAPAAPYGMDPVPDSVFSSRPWNHYGSDPVPEGATSDLGARVDYGLDAIPGGHVPTILHLRDVLPHEALQVLTEAIEGGMADGAAREK